MDLTTFNRYWGDSWNMFVASIFYVPIFGEIIFILIAAVFGWIFSSLLYFDSIQKTRFIGYCLWTWILFMIAIALIRIATLLFRR